jgi:hypothetical protein
MDNTNIKINTPEYNLATYGPLINYVVRQAAFVYHINVKCQKARPCYIYTMHTTRPY